MPAYFDCGFSVREPSWHRQELLLDEYPTDWNHARKLAGLEWEPTAQPVFTQKMLTAEQIELLASEDQILHHVVATDAGRPDGLHTVLVAAEGHQAIVRNDNGEVLAVPSDSYSLISHADMGDIIDAVLGSDSNVKFETAGSVRDGRQVWALVRLDEPYQVGGDDSPTYPFLAILNAHDGSAACSATITDIRVVCWNTWSAADQQGERNGTRHVFRHTGDTKQRIEEAKTLLARLRQTSHETRELFERLAQVPVRDDQVMSFTELFLPSPRDVGEQCSDRVHENVVTARGTFGQLYTESMTTEGIRGTAYGLLQASTEYLDHLRGFRTRDSYVGRTILRPERLKDRALALMDKVGITN